MQTNSEEFEGGTATGMRPSRIAWYFVFIHAVIGFAPGIIAVLASIYKPLILPIGLTSRLFPISVLPPERCLLALWEQLEGVPSGSFAGNLFAEQLTVISFIVIIVSILVSTAQIYMGALWPYSHKYMLDIKTWKRLIVIAIAILGIIALRSSSIFMLMHGRGDIEQALIMTDDIRAKHSIMLEYILAPFYLMMCSYVEGALVTLFLYRWWKFRV